MSNRPNLYPADILSVLKRITDPVFALDPHWTVTYINDEGAGLLGKPKEELSGRNLWECIPEAVGTRFYEMAQQSILAQQACDFTDFFRPWQRWLHIRLYPSFSGMTVLCQDASGLRREAAAEREPAGRFGSGKPAEPDASSLHRRELLAIVGQLAAAIAHELRNPLTSLKGFLQLLEAKAPPCDKYYFDIMQEELSRIEMLAAELLVLGKPQAVQFEEAEPADIMRQALALLGPQAVCSNVSIVSRIQPDVPNVLCVAGQLKQVFVHIIANAIEAMPDGGTVEISLSRSDDGSLQADILDQGAGIPDEVLCRIGEPFYTTKDKGTGLGYMVALKIIELHRGRLEIDSQSGKGTRVSITLPAASASASASP